MIKVNLTMPSRGSQVKPVVHSPLETLANGAIYLDEAREDYGTHTLTIHPQ
jgi:hypothetical protein